MMFKDKFLKLDNEKYINKYDVILINIQDFLSESKNVDRLIINLNKALTW